MLVDTSAWLYYFKPLAKIPASEQAKAKSIHQIIDQAVLNDRLLYSCPTIVQEILQGAINSKELALLTRTMRSLVLLTFDDQFSLAEKAAKLYRDVRKKGVTVRKSNDCRSAIRLIAYYALHFQQPVLHADRDFALIAQATVLQIVAM